MEFQERRKTPRGNSVEQLAQRIRDGILRGRYAQGQRLIERDLIEESGFSRSTVREAFGRGAEPWEVANVMVFLASDYSSYMTGEVVSVSSQHA